MISPVTCFRYTIGLETDFTNFISALHLYQDIAGVNIVVIVELHQHPKTNVQGRY